MTYLILIIIFLIPLFGHLSVKVSQRYYWFECITVILVMGLRYYVGGDTIGYMTKYDYASPIYDLSVVDFVIAEYQPLWVVVQSICKTISEDFYILQLFVSTVINITVFWVIEKYASNKFLAGFLYMISNMLNFNCEVLRAAFSISVFFLAYEELLKKNLFRYYILVIIAFLFHDQAIILFLIPFVMPFLRKPMSPVLLCILFLTGFLFTLPPVIALYAPYLPGDRGEKFAQGYASMSIGSVFGMIRTIISVYLIYFITRTNFIKSNEKLLPAVNIYLCCNVIGICMPIFITRVSQFFVIYYICALSTFIYLYKRSLAKTAVVAVWIFGVFRYYTQDVTSWVNSNEHATDRYYFYERFFPYYSIWEEPDQTVLMRRKEIADQEMLKE